MVDRIDIGIDTEQETDTGFFTSRRTVTPEQYTSSFINFYNTALGLPSLEEETGIEVETPTVELAEPTVREPSEEGGPPNILEMTSFATGEPLYDVQFVDGTQAPAGSYSAYLGGTTFKDRIPFVKNILEPTMTGNFKDIKFGETVSAEVEAGVEAVKTGAKELPSSFELAAKRMTGKELTPAENAKLDKTYANITKGLLPLVGGIPGAIASTAIGGRTVKNAFGQNSFLPTGPLGMMGEIVHAKQYDDMAKIKAARMATGSYDTATGRFIADMTVDTGFAVRIGNMGITRAPGSGTFTGNTQGLSIEQLLALEAVSKGYDPTRGRYNALDPSKNQSVAESGGMFVSDNPMDGFFRANGTFYSSRTGASAAYANQKDSIRAAATAGISYDEFQDALSAARSGSKTLDAAIQDIKGAKTAAAARQRDEDRPPEPAPTTPEPQREDSGGSYFSDLGGGRTEPSGANWGAPSAGGVSGSYGPDPEAYGFATGGRVGLAMGGAPGMASGFVDRPPEQVPEDQTVADNRPAQLPEGAFVINAAAVEFAGSNDVKDMLLKAHKESIRRGLTVDKQGNGAKLIDVAISSGEVVVAPHLAKIIGYDRLEKINNRGKAETRERIEENGQQPVGAAEGGFIDYPGELDDIGEDVPMDSDIPAETMQQFEAFTQKQRQRGDVERLIDNLDDRSALALAILTETVASRDNLQSMEAVGQVIVNRANTNDPDFKNVNTVKDVLKQRSGRGKGSKMFQFDGLEPTSVRDRLKEITSGRAPNALNKVFAAAENVLSRQQPNAESQPILPDHVLYYTKPGASGAGFFENNPLLEPFSEIGGHNFYAKHLTKEFP